MEQVEKQEGCSFEIDLQAQTLIDAQGNRISFEVDAFFVKIFSSRNGRHRLDFTV